jgi:hypothetical protein
MSTDSIANKEAKDQVKHNRRERQLNDKSLVRIRDDQERVLTDLAGWLHEDCKILNSDIDSVYPLCQDDASRVLFDGFRSDIEKIQDECTAISSGALANSPGDDSVAKHPEYMIKISRKIQEILPLTAQLSAIRDKLREVNQVKQLIENGVEEDDDEPKDIKGDSDENGFIN